MGLNKEIILGKDGTQLFPITNIGVSRQHARISIRNGAWHLEDMDSTNGTYIMDENGDYKRIGAKDITEDTVIRLGDSSIRGFSFVAHHVIEEDPNNYSYEFQRLSKLHDDLNEECERIKKRTNMISYIRSILSLLPLAVTFIPGIGNDQRISVIRIGAAIPIAFNLLFSKNTRMLHHNDKVQKLLTCPCCGNQMSKTNIIKGMCPVCKAHL